MSDALKRRCLHLWIDYPAEELECKILDDQGAGHRGAARRGSSWPMMHRIRELDLKKTPSISETLDWARARCMALNADDDRGRRSSTRRST